MLAVQVADAVWPEGVAAHAFRLDAVAAADAQIDEGAAILQVAQGFDFGFSEHWSLDVWTV